MKRYLVAALILIVCLSQAGCFGGGNTKSPIEHERPEQPEQVYSVKGKVTLGDGTPLEGVNFYNYRTETMSTTDAQGQYTVSGLMGEPNISPLMTYYYFRPRTIIVKEARNDVDFIAYPETIYVQDWTIKRIMAGSFNNPTYTDKIACAITGSSTFIDEEVVLTQEFVDDFEVEVRELDREEWILLPSESPAYHTFPERDTPNPGYEIKIIKKATGEVVSHETRELPNNQRYPIDFTDITINGERITDDMTLDYSKEIRVDIHNFEYNKEFYVGEQVLSLWAYIDHGGYQDIRVGTLHYEEGGECYFTFELYKYRYDLPGKVTFRLHGKLSNTHLDDKFECYRMYFTVDMLSPSISLK